MRRLARWTLNALTVLSLVLCVAMAGLWVQSAHRWHALLWVSAHRHLCVATAWGRIVLQAGQEFESEGYALHSGYYAGRFPRQLGGDSEDEREWPVWLMVTCADRTPAWLKWAGIGVADGPHTPDYTTGFRHTEAYVPYPYAIALFLLLPAAALFKTAARGLRRRKGRCQSCSYDLTGNISGVCPECGSPVEAVTGPGSGDLMS